MDTKKIEKWSTEDIDHFCTKFFMKWTQKCIKMVHWMNELFFYEISNRMDTNKYQEGPQKILTAFVHGICPAKWFSHFLDVHFENQTRNFLNVQVHLVTNIFWLSFFTVHSFDVHFFDVCFLSIFWGSFLANDFPTCIFDVLQCLTYIFLAFVFWHFLEVVFGGTALARYFLTHAFDVHFLDVHFSSWIFLDTLLHIFLTHILLLKFFIVIFLEKNNKLWKKCVNPLFFNVTWNGTNIFRYQIKVSVVLKNVKVCTN